MKKEKTTIESVTNKLVMSLNSLNNSNSPRKINHPKYTTLAIITIILDDLFQNYFKN